ncbi:MAG: NUDIX domain-containing protein [Oscillospiraceae bacterium]
MKKEKSCGAICYQKSDDKIEILLIKHRYGGHWSFPKGHVEKGEDEETTAMREVREESGAEIKILDGYREINTYSPSKGAIKDVIIFVAQIIGGRLLPQPEEVSEVAMLSYDAALERLTFETDRLMLAKAKQMIFDVI